MNKKISIIIPIYNAAQYLRQCLDSAINQTFRDIEIICINDGSTDESLSILEKYRERDSRIKIINQQNFGYGYSMNVGIKEATGEYIGIIEADDFVDTNMYYELYKIAEATDADIVKSGYWEYFEFLDDSSSYKKEAAFLAKIKPPNNVFSIYEYPNLLYYHPSIWSGIYKRSFLLQYNLHFVEAPGGGWVDNPFFMQALCLAKNIAWIKAAYYFYRQTNPKSSTNSLADWTIPFIRCIEIHDFFEAQNINDPGVLTCFYKREFHYLNNAVIATDWTNSEVNKLIKEMMLRMNREIVIKNHVLTVYEKQLFIYILNNFSKQGDFLDLTDLPKKTIINNTCSKLINKLIKILK